MIYIKLSERLKYSAPSTKRNVITGDECWPFTEQPTIEKPELDKKRIPAHDLFNLFTADIIRTKKVFVR